MSDNLNLYDGLSNAKSHKLELFDQGSSDCSDILSSLFSAMGIDDLENDLPEDFMLTFSLWDLSDNKSYSDEFNPEKCSVQSQLQDNNSLQQSISEDLRNNNSYDDQKDFCHQNENNCCDDQNDGASALSFQKSEIPREERKARREVRIQQCIKDFCHQNENNNCCDDQNDGAAALSVQKSAIPRDEHKARREVRIQQCIKDFCQQNEINCCDDQNDGASALSVQKSAIPREERKARREVRIQQCINLLEHACQCRELSCYFGISCEQMKRLITHTNADHSETNRLNCVVCNQLFSLCYYHAKHCQDTRCSVPSCLNIRYLRQQRLQQNTWQQQHQQQQHQPQQHQPQQHQQQQQQQQQQQPVLYSQTNLISSQHMEILPSYFASQTFLPPPPPPPPILSLDFSIPPPSLPAFFPSVYSHQGNLITPADGYWQYNTRVEQPNSRNHIYSLNQEGQRRTTYQQDRGIFRGGISYRTSTYTSYNYSANAYKWTSRNGFVQRRAVAASAQERNALHHRITPALRSYLVHKLVQAVTAKSRRSLVHYAQRIEDNIYAMATSKLDYRRQVEGKIFKIRNKDNFVFSFQRHHRRF